MNNIKKYQYLLQILFIYIIAFGIGFISIYFININSLILKVFLFDIIATIIVYIFSCICKNSSVYDPYWSVVPGGVALFLFFYFKAYNLISILTLISILLYSFRLTINWMTVTTGFSYEDWRYRHFRDKSNGNKFYWFILNFFGIHLVPTLFVFLGMLPMFDIFSASSLSLLSLIGVLVIILGILLEYFADVNMHKFLNTAKEKVTCRYGLWKYSRHPNYLGEILIWVGIFITMIFSIQTHWYYAIGMLGMIFMFNVISIPLMEKRQINRRSDYINYKKEVSRLLILPNKKKD